MGFLKSSSVNPVALSMARAGARAGSSYEPLIFILLPNPDNQGLALRTTLLIQGGMPSPYGIRIPGERSRRFRYRITPAHPQGE